MAFSTYLRNQWLNAAFGAIPFSVGNVYISLHDGHPGDTGANEISGGSYARQAWTGNAAGSALVDNNGDIAWTDMPEVPSGTPLVFAGAWNQLTGGQFLGWAALGGAADVFTAANTGDLITAYGHGLTDGDRVTVKGNNLPTGLSEGTVYFVVTATTDTLQLEASVGGGAITLTSNGAGTLQFLNSQFMSAGATFTINTGDLDWELLS